MFLATLGNLIDRLIIVRFKWFHKTDKDELIDLEKQIDRLTRDIKVFIEMAAKGELPEDEITMLQHKVYNKKGNEVDIDISGDIGKLIDQLIETNWKMWQTQDELYNFKAKTPDERDEIIHKTVIHNLERNKLIDAIDTKFKEKLEEK